MRPDRLDPDGKPISYLTLGSALTSGIYNLENDADYWARVEYELAEINHLAENPDTALLAFSKELGVVNVVIGVMTVDMLFSNVQHVLKSYNLLKTPISTRTAQQAEANVMELISDPEPYLARLSRREQDYLNARYADSLPKDLEHRRFSQLKLGRLGTAEKMFYSAVHENVGAANQIFAHYVGHKTAFPESMTLVLRRTISLSLITGRSSSKQLHAKLKKQVALSEQEIEGEFALCLGDGAWVKPMDLEFADTLDNGVMNLTDLTKFCNPAALLSRLIDTPPKALPPRNLTCYAQLILDLCEMCLGEIATRAARHLSLSLLSSKLLEKSELPTVIGRLTRYELDPVVGLNLKVMRFATGKITAVVKRDYDVRLAMKGLKAMVKDPIVLREALLALDQKVNNSLTRRIGQAFSSDLGL